MRLSDPLPRPLPCPRGILILTPTLPCPLACPSVVALALGGGGPHEGAPKSGRS